MPSQFADAIVNRFGANDQAAIAVDKELEVVRDVINDLLDLADLEGVGDSDSCQRARDLLEKLRLRKD